MIQFDKPKPQRSGILDRVLGPRIAQKIFLGYVLPLSVLLAFGIVLPIFLWFYLGRSVHELDTLALIADNATSLKQTAIDTDNHASGFIRYHDHTFDEEFIEARDAYRLRYRDLESLVEERDDPALTQAISEVSMGFRSWIRWSVKEPYRRAQLTAEPPGQDAKAIDQAADVHHSFGKVQESLDGFITLVNQKRVRQSRRSHAADLIRHVTSVVIPTVAILLSLLIGRSTALGITRPLEALMAATRDLERGTPPVLLFLGNESEMVANDEIGDLQHAFRQMVKTIGQREAVLHAQNEAVGALNRRIESVLNATNDGILMLDRAGGFSVVNQRLADLFGLEMDSLLDHTFGQAGSLLIARFRNRAAVRKRLQDVIDDPEAVADEIYDLVEPHSRTIRVYSAPVRGHQLIPTSPQEAEGGVELLGRIFVFRDVTRETMLDRMKTEFVSTVSHELRTPLTAIKGYVDLMVTGQTGPLNDVQTEFLTLVQGSTRRLTNLINDMLDVSRIESGKMELRQESVNYLPLVRQTIRMMQQEADARGIKLTVEAPGEDSRRAPIAVRGDADRITQVLTNFLSNGIKYTHAGGNVTVSVEFEDDFVTTCVSDDGIGISPEDQRRLFQKFFRADNSTTREAGGTGLGLAITKAILEKLNGSVWVESGRGVGTRFYFTLPCVSDIEPDGASASASNVYADHENLAGASALVLPISGDLPALHRIGHELRRQSFVTSGASTLGEGVRRIKDLRPDVVLLDPITPQLDGRAFLTTLASSRPTPHVPIIIASIHLQNDNAAVFRDDIVLINENVTATTELSHALEGAHQAAVLRRADQPSQSSDSHALTVLCLSRDRTLKHLVERALGESHRSAVVMSAANTAELAPFLRAESSLRIPDIIVIGESGDDRTENLGGMIARLRKRKQDEWIACILLMPGHVLSALNIETLAPMGSGSLPIEDVGPIIRNALNPLHDRQAASVLAT